MSRLSSSPPTNTLPLFNNEQRATGRVERTLHQVALEFTRKLVPLISVLGGRGRGRYLPLEDGKQARRLFCVLQWRPAQPRQLGQAQDSGADVLGATWIARSSFGETLLPVGEGMVVRENFVLERAVGF